MPASLELSNELIENRTFLDTSGWLAWDADLTAHPDEGYLTMMSNAFVNANDFGAWTIFEDARPVEHSYSVEMFVPLGQEAYIWIGYYTGEHTEPGTQTGWAPGTDFIGTGDWQLLEGTFTPPDNARSIEWGPFWGDVGNTIPSVYGDQIHMRNPSVSRPHVQPRLELSRSLTPNPDLDLDISDWDVRRGTPVWEATADTGGVLRITSTVGAGQTTTALPEAADPVLLPDWGEILFKYLPGETYSYSFRSLSDNGKDMFVYVAYATEDGNETAENHQQDFVGTGDWQTIEGTFTVPETVAGGLTPVGGYFAIGMDSSDNAVGKVWRLDDMRLDRVNPSLDFAPVQNEIKRLTITDISPPSIGGEFTLTFDGETTAGIPVFGAALDVRLALEALPNIEPGDVVCTDEALAGATFKCLVEFSGRYSGQDVGSLVIGTAGLTGDVSVSTANLQNGSGAAARLETTP